jgi:hypothetical protein
MGAVGEPIIIFVETENETSEVSFEQFCKILFEEKVI